MNNHVTGHYRRNEENANPQNNVNEVVEEMETQEGKSKAAMNREIIIDSSIIVLTDDSLFIS